MLDMDHFWSPEQWLGTTVLDLQMCYDKKKREKTFFIHVVKRICFLCLNNLESN